MKAISLSNCLSTCRAAPALPCCRSLSSCTPTSYLSCVQPYTPTPELYCILCTMLYDRNCPHHKAMTCHKRAAPALTTGVCCVFQRQPCEHTQVQQSSYINKISCVCPGVLPAVRQCGSGRTCGFLPPSVRAQHGQHGARCAYRAERLCTELRRSGSGATHRTLHASCVLTAWLNV